MVPSSFLRHLIDSSQSSCRYGQVVVGPCFRQVRRRKIDGDQPIGPRQLSPCHCCSNPFFCLRERRIRQADEHSAREATSLSNLDLHHRSFNPIERHGPS